MYQVSTSIRPTRRVGLSIGLAAIGLACVVIAPRVSRAQTLDNAPLLTVEGRQTKILDYHKDKVLVITYTGVGCPISGKYAPRLERLSKEYAKRGVRFVGINANPQDSRETMAREAKDLGLSFPMLKDFRQELTRGLDAKTTTEVFVIDKSGKIRYRGAVDDQYALGAQKPEPGKTYLRDALEAVLADKAVSTQRTDAPGCLITRLSVEELPEAVTYSSHVARIIQDQCQNCHRPFQIGPMSLGSYEQVKGWSAMIQQVIDDGRMPPWNAAPEFDGHFSNERRLPQRERDLIKKWIEDGMPRGNPEEDPPKRDWPKGWRIGEPDAVVAMAMERKITGRRGQGRGRQVSYEPIPEGGVSVPREGVVPYRYFTAKTDFEEDKWVRAMEIKPGAPDVVHHVLVSVEDPKDPSSRRSLNGGVGGYFCAVVPGDTPSIFPDGYAKKLPAGAILHFQVHYTPNGKARKDISSIGMIFTDEPVEHEVRTSSIFNAQFLRGRIPIPPGDADFEIRANTPLLVRRALRDGTTTIDRDIELLSFMPHMHTRGKSFTYLAHLPDGTTKTLLDVPAFDFNWQETYILAKPIHIPAGTTMECIAHFDNSAGNPNNPDPTEAVTWGEQTWEEMLIGYFDYIPSPKTKGRR